MFGIVNIVGNFGTVFCDQAYWQSSVAAKPLQVRQYSYSYNLYLVFVGSLHTDNILFSPVMLEFAGSVGLHLRRPHLVRHPLHAGDHDGSGLPGTLLRPGRSHAH